MCTENYTEELHKMAWFCAKHMLAMVIASNEVISNIHEVEAFGQVLVNVQRC